MKILCQQTAYVYDILRLFPQYHILRYDSLGRRVFEQYNLLKRLQMRLLKILNKNKFITDKNPIYL